MLMRPRSVQEGKIARPSGVEGGSLSRFSAPAGTATRPFALAAGALIRWFGSCSGGVSVFRALPLLVVSCLVGGLLAGDARADGPVPPATDLPAVLSMAEALRIFRARGLDLLIAEAAVKSAEGDVAVAGAVPNPVGTAGYGRVLNYDPGGCDQCSANYWAVGLSDSAAIEDAISGKRGLRLKVARNALAAAKLSRVDAQRTLEFQVKSAYVQIAQAVLSYRFAKEVVDSNEKTLELFQVRYKGGAINEGDLARVETQKLESDQALDAANEAVRQSRVALAFLIGVRGAVPDFDVDTSVLTFASPQGLVDASEEGLLRSAFERRPDLVAAGYQKASAQASIELARRQKLPDITLSVNYSQTGTGATPAGGAISPPTLVFGVSAPLPVFYQMQGELRKAEAAYDTNALGQAKATAQVVSDVASGFAAYVAARQLVQRMESGGLLKSAKTARDITRLQFEKGAAGLTDLLDAQRTYIATNVEYIQDVTNYWTAVFQLEQAVGMELH
jgi:outer membrane protein, heavy metal efflux system